MNDINFYVLSFFMQIWDLLLELYNILPGISHISLKAYCVLPEVGQVGQNMSWRILISEYNENLVLIDGLLQCSFKLLLDSRNA